jgi:putative MATE family efflux protein
MLEALKLHPHRDRRIIRLSGPIVGGMLSQTLVNLVDTAMVGRLSASALAAVGLGATATWLCVSLLLGIGSATQALVARRIGEGRPAEAGRTLDNALVLGGASGLLAGVAVYLLTPALMSLLASDALVEQMGCDYLRMRTIGFPFVVINFAFRGFYHGIGDTRTYLKAIALTNAVNVVLDLLLIFGLAGFPRMGARGAGLATALGLASGTLYYTLWASWRTGLRRRFSAFRLAHLCRDACRGLLAILAPNGMMSLGTALGFMIFYWMLARIGTVEVAVNNVLMNVASVFYLPALGMGLAAATLVGQSLGRQEPAEAEAWGWETARLATYALAACGLVLVVAPGPVIRAFTDDPVVVERGRLAMQILGVGQFATALTMVLSNVLVSAGNARWVAVVNVAFTYLGVLPAVYVGCVMLGGGVALAWVFQGLGRLGIGVALMLRFRAGAWKLSRL